MAAQNVKKREVKKSFFDVKAPMTSAKISLYASSEQEIVGKVVTLDLTKSLRGKAFEMKLKVEMVDNELVAEPVSLWLSGSYIRRMVRKGTDYVEDSFVASCKDADVIIKPFLITRNKVSRAVRHALRKTARDYVEKYLTTRTSKELFSEITANKLQKELSLKLKKVYPLALCEIRVFEIKNKR
ncbi:hypothetical protein COU54_00850 [Candidatus Pacearchaeota archaeon CG10_big_fil_rev_8_21_14_0_10_31_24]|nr:MAG: hypothetical protein COU54_00850 [Candidatus Pacearchaeota archaeon CG10_big_fil_rev_8_21_14_0_10_31_24]